VRDLARAIGAALLCWLLAGLGAAHAAPQLVVWAWERPEDLRFLPADVEIAVQTGFVELHGDHLFARARRFPLMAADRQVATALVHVQIDHRQPLRWTPDLRRQLADAVIRLASSAHADRLQLDFEVRASERQVLLDLTGDLRQRLPAGHRLSMTALAAWCDTEDWVRQAGADEVAPMLFRMGPKGEALKSRLAGGGDFSNPECRKAFAVSVDAPLVRAPVDGEGGPRRIYLFSPRSWTATDFENLRHRIANWAAVSSPSPPPPP